MDVVRILIYAPVAARAEIRAAAEKIKAKYLIDAKHPPAPDWTIRWPQPSNKKHDGDN